MSTLFDKLNNNENYFFNSGLKILLLSNIKELEQFHCAPSLQDRKNDRYNIVKMSVADFEVSAQALLAWNNQFKAEFYQKVKCVHYYRENENFCLRLIKKLKWNSFFLNHFFVAFFLFKKISIDKTLNSIWQRLKLSWMGVKSNQAKLIAKQLNDADIGLMVVSPPISVGEQLLMLTSALYAKIPILFHDEETLFREQTMNVIKKIEPTVHHMQQRRRRADVKHISDIYGAKAIIANYCHLDRDNICIPGFWMHGWIPAYHNVHSAFIALHKSERRGFHLPWSRDSFDPSHLQLVARQDQETFLKKNGYTHVKAIGHPLVYLEEKIIPTRIKNSLLVMPPHGTGKRDKNDPQVQAYVDYIHSIRSNFDKVQLCITVDDYLKKNWWPAFQKINIENIISVDRSNLKSLHRLFHILSQFEYVTTNGFGSIVAYAAFAGCKISVSGPYVEIPENLLKKAHAVKHFPELLEKQIELCTEQSFRSHYPELFTDPKLASERIAWGKFELGHQHKLSPEEMRELVILRKYSS